MLKKLNGLVMGAIMILALTASAFAIDKPKIGVVMKIGGIPWFTAMQTGLDEQAEKLGWDAEMIGPETTDPALQIQAIEDLIKQNVDAIGVVPNNAAALEAVLKKARNKGIVVITHESPEQKNVDWNFELASIRSFGEEHAKLLAEKMGEKGEYAVFVGSLTVPLHNAWADAAIAYLTKNFPEMKLVGSRYGVAENADKSRQTALKLMSENPDLTGFITFGSQGPIGAGRAVKDAEKVGKVFVIGTFSPSQGISLIKSDVISGGYMWSPRQAGRIFVTIADDLKKGIIIKDGLKIDGMGKVYPKGTNIIVDQLVSINKDTIDELVRMGAKAKPFCLFGNFLCINGR